MVKNDLDFKEFFKTKRTSIHDGEFAEINVKHHENLHSTSMSAPDEIHPTSERENHTQEDELKEDEKQLPPDWLNLEYIQKSIREGLEEPDVVITNFEIIPATIKGENYATIVYKCKATEKSGREYLTILKCLPGNAMRQKFGNMAQIFRKEIDMYSVILPDYEEMLKECGKDVFWPKYYYSTIDGQKDTIVLEDASPYGYVMGKRRLGLNVGHLEVVLDTLGCFHACSVAMKLRGPDVFERKVAARFPETLLTNESKEMSYFAEKSMVSAAEIIRGWNEEKYLKIADKILEWKDSIYLETVELIKPKEGALLNHGDFWMNNMLFRYEKTDEEKGSVKPTEIMMLDFQLARHSSPAADLVYLLITSVDNETRNKHWKRLLQHIYLKSFWKTLDILGHKNDIRNGLYSIDWLESEIRAYRKFALFIASSTLKVVLASTEDAIDLDEIKEEDMLEGVDILGKLGNDDVFQRRYRSIIDELEETGLFK